MSLADTSGTIIALSTPPGAGAIALLRLSGPRAFPIAASFLSPRRVFGNPRPRTAYMLTAVDGKKTLDRTVALFYKKPKSYTGENTVEIFCHGSPYVVRSILNLALKAGARTAGPGEFTLRAFLKGKLDLAQAEAVNDLIAAENERAHSAALGQIEGCLSRQVAGLKSKLTGLLAELEARLDDSYGDTPPLDEGAFLCEAGRVLGEIRALASGFESGRRVREGINVVIAGAPNSGKSSLFNALLGYARAIVSPAACTTRDTLEAGLEIGGFRVNFTDTAGLSAGPQGNIDRQAMTRAKTAMEKADIILLVKDASVARTRMDRLALDAALKEAGRGAEVINILNKCDLAAAVSPGKGELALSCRTGKGLGAVRRAVIRRETRCLAGRAPALVTSARHFEALTLSAGELEKLPALAARKPFPLELAAEHVRAASRAAARILGETAPDDVLADIFKNFCVGK